MTHFETSLPEQRVLPLEICQFCLKNHKNRDSRHFLHYGGGGDTSDRGLEILCQHAHPMEQFPVLTVWDGEITYGISDFPRPLYIQTKCQN